MNNVIDFRGSPKQPCWGCGKLAGGDEHHYYYGNFQFGVHHGICGERIQKILDRSLRALGAIGKDLDGHAHEVVLKDLITTAAEDLGNRLLNEIPDDEIRNSVETKGMEKALETLRFFINQKTWDTHWKECDAILKGPETLPPEQPDQETIDTIEEIKELLEESLQAKQARNENCMNALKRFQTQFRSFASKCQTQQNEKPYCIFENVFGPYYQNSSEKKVKKLLEEINETDNWKVIFLAEEVPDQTYKYITHIIVEHIAMLPSSTPLSDAEKIWQQDHSPKNNTRKAVVVPLDCLEWQNHWVIIREMGSTRISFGGSKPRPTKE